MVKISFVNGRLFIGDGRVVDEGSVVIEGERIVDVNTETSAPPDSTDVIDLEGATLLPGLIDCHIHICSDGSNDPWTNRRDKSVAAITLLAADMAKKTIMNGVTTIRDMGAPDGIDLALRDAVASGLIIGPRMLVSCRCVCMTGGHGWRAGREADGPNEVRKAAREQIKAGADQFKIMASGGVMTPGVEPGAAQYTEEEMRAGIDEAHKAGRMAATHAQGKQAILNAVMAGIDTIEHGFYVDEEAAALMVEKNVYFVPTLAAVHQIVANGVEGGVPEYAVKKAEKIQALHRENLMKAKEAGVIIGMGTDAGTPYNAHGQNLQELKLLVDAGFTPTESLIAATKTAAEVIGMNNDLGMLETGRLADLVVCDGDPTKDVSLLTDPANIKMIYLAGRKIR
jgi:imidazolonepropionase-like amidohydrolase